MIENFIELYFLVINDINKYNKLINRVDKTLKEKMIIDFEEIIKEASIFSLMYGIKKVEGFI